MEAKNEEEEDEREEKGVAAVYEGVWVSLDQSVLTWPNKNFMTSVLSFFLASTLFISTYLSQI